MHFAAGGFKALVASRNLVVDCGGATHVLQTVLMAYPNQASSLQGSHSVSCDILAVDDLGTGSGWQQSKQNQALLAVVGKGPAAQPVVCWSAWLSTVLAQDHF